MSQSFVNINEKGIAFLHQRPAAVKRMPANHQPKPVQVALHHDLTLELFGDGFSASVKLSAGDALGLMAKVSYVLREHLEVEKGIK